MREPTIKMPALAEHGDGENVIVAMRVSKKNEKATES